MILLTFFNRFFIRASGFKTWGWGICINSKRSNHFNGLPPPKPKWMNKKNPNLSDGIRAIQRLTDLFLNCVYNRLECFRVVQSQIGKSLTVQFDSTFVNSSDELRITHSVLTSSSIDTLNP